MSHHTTTRTTGLSTPDLNMRKISASFKIECRRPSRITSYYRLSKTGMPDSHQKYSQQQTTSYSKTSSELEVLLCSIKIKLMRLASQQMRTSETLTLLCSRMKMNMIERI